MPSLDITALTRDFPEYHVALLVARDLEIPPENPRDLNDRIAETQAAVTANFHDLPLSQCPQLATWRNAYKAFGIRKTSYRPSVERLIRQILQGRGLPRINAFVDCYNEISARFLVPVGADDLDAVTENLFFRYGGPADSFIPLGSEEENPPKEGEVVYADEEKVLCRRWNWFQDARSAIRLASRRAVVTLQGFEEGRAAAAAAELAQRLPEDCGGSCGFEICNRAKPKIVIAS